MSDFNILAVLSDAAETSPLYPIPGEAADTVEAEADDGQPRLNLVATELVVHEIPSGGKSKRVMQLQKLKAKVIVTDSRLIVACSKYEKGGGWVGFGAGGLAVAATANTISKVRTSKRRKGKMLVGHIRYPQLTYVGFQPSLTAFGHNRLRLGLVDPTVGAGRGLALDLTLPRQQPGSDTARQVTALAAHYRLSHNSDELSDAAREHLQSLTNPPALPAGAGKFSLYWFKPSTTSQQA